MADVTKPATQTENVLTILFGLPILYGAFEFGSRAIDLGHTAAFWYGMFGATFAAVSRSAWALFRARRERRTAGEGSGTLKRLEKLPD